jgi:hypothetical protein
MTQYKHNQLVDFSNPNADKIKSAATTNNMAQKTAVEWLLNEFTNSNYGVEVGEQAKEMEKQQIENAQMDMFNQINDRKFGMDYFHKRDEAETYVKHYYTETYKSK